MTRPSRALRIVLVALFATSSASAQLGGRVRREGGRVPAPTLSARTLRTRLGIEVAEALLKDSSAEERQRGFERLGSIGTAQALDLLLKVFETGGAAHSAPDRLVAVRALSEHVSVPAVRDFLIRVMVGVGSNPGRSEAIDGLIERAAALSLARAGDDASLAALGKALRQSGHVADTASDALLAFPPRNLEPIVAGLRAPTRAMARFLGTLGDARAIPALREIVRSAPKDVRPDAALALAQLGLRETVELARHWLKHETDPELRSAAARILLTFHESDASAAVTSLLGDERSRPAGLALANEVSLPEVTEALVRGARAATGAEQSDWFAALGRSGSREALSFLGGSLGTRETSSAAALALALSPTADAEAVLERALRDPKTRRAALRATLVRKVALDRTPSGWQGALRELSGSRDPSDRALYAQASVLFSPEKAAELVPHAPLPELRALCRLALLTEVARALAVRLAIEPDPVARDALSASLVSSQAAELVPSDVLSDLVDAGGLGAPLAVRALAARDSRTLRPKISALLESDDPVWRSQAALGLGESRESSALGILERAYRFETDDTVRLAIVLALAARREPARRRGLGVARKLDAAAAVRQAAALALTGAKAARETTGPTTAWLELRLVQPEASLPSSAVTRGALLITGSGLALPAFADSDGVLLVSALPSGAFELRLAAPTRTDDAAKTKTP
ncbi:MAG: HEAT repeat domain-containing protein [Polyangiaceae bacterium]